MMYNSEEIVVKMKKLFEENGLEIFTGEEDSVLEIDSLRLIALIVAVEEAFEVEVPDEYISQELFISFTDFCEMVNTILCS